MGTLAVEAAVSQMTPEAFMATVPKSPAGNTAWAVRAGQELRNIIVHQASTQPRNVQRHLGPSELGAECLSGETEVVTRQGRRKIRDLAKDGTAELLVPMLYEGSDVRKRWGRFCRVPVECFGKQELFEVTLRRNQDTKIVFATASHHWFRSYWSGKNKKQERLATTDLRSGHKLTQLRRAMPQNTTLMPVAVAQGFVFGDGKKGSEDDRHRPAELALVHNGKDEALLSFFPGEHRVYHRASDTYPYTRIRGLPRFWKLLPPIDESVSFLMSWLAGYFAADGCVTNDGHCSISSAYEENLEFVRNIAAICGVGYGRVQKHMRRGISGTQPAENETPLYQLGLRRRDLPAWFFLTAQHAERARIASLVPERDPHWIVESVQPAGRTEPVYCAITGEPGAFALADDLMTGNCSRQVVGKMIGARLAPRTNNVFDPWPAMVGTAVHALFALFFERENKRTGILNWLTEQPVTPFEGHPGTADLYWVPEAALIDHKVLGPSSLAKVKSPRGPSRRYVFQLLLYKQGLLNANVPVKRIALAAYPRTESTLDGMYVWERPDGPQDTIDIQEVIAETEVRKLIADEILAGRMTLDQVDITPDDDECFYCPFYRPQSAYDNGPGCPGTIGNRSITQRS